MILKILLKKNLKVKHSIIQSIKLLILKVILKLDWALLKLYLQIQIKHLYLYKGKII